MVFRMSPRLAGLAALTQFSILLLPGRVMAADTYDMSADFSTSVNTDKSVWAYGYNVTGAHDGKYTLMTSSADLRGQLGVFLAPSANPGKTRLITNAFPCWYTPAATTLAPSFCNNPSTNNAVASFRLGKSALYTARIAPAHSVTIEPPPHGLAVVSFLVPRGGNVNVLFEFTPNDYSCYLPGSGAKADGIVWSVDRNTEMLTYGPLASTSAMDIGTTGVVNLTVAVNQGDRLNFTVAGNNGNVNCNSTILTARLTVP
jgi:hypothetical protein